MSTLFPIMLEVEESQLGPVLRRLNGMPGIAKLHLDLDMAPRIGGKAPKQAIFKERDPQGPRGPRQKDVVMQLLLSGPKHLDEIKAEFIKQGWTAASSANSALNQLREAGITESGGVAIHKLTDRARSELVKALPKPAEPHAERPPGRLSAPAIILNKLSEATTPVPRAALIDAIVAAGHGATNINGALGKLKNNKQIAAPATGFYELTAAGRKYLTKITSANGAPNG